MESSGFRRLLLASYNIAPQGGGEDVAEDHSRAHTQIKAPLAPPKEASHALSAISLGCSDPDASRGRHMPEPTHIACAATLAASNPRGLQDRATSGAHMSCSGQGRSAAPSTSGGTRLHPSLRASTGASAASFTTERHFHLLPKNRRSLICLIF